MKRCKVPFCGQEIFESQDVCLDCALGDVPGRPTWQQHAKKLEHERDELKAAIMKALGWLDVGLVWNARKVLEEAFSPSGVGAEIAEEKV